MHTYLLKETDNFIEELNKCKASKSFIECFTLKTYIPLIYGVIISFSEEPEVSLKNILIPWSI